MRSLPRCIALLALAAFPTVARSDELVLPEHRYTDVVVAESNRAYYLLFPEDGSIEPVPKEALAEEARVIVAADFERDRLRREWLEKHVVRRNAIREEKKAVVMQSEEVQERRALGLRMAEEDLKRFARNDSRFDRYDRRWRRPDANDEALRLLLRGEDDATIQLASMAVDPEFMSRFVNMALVERVRQAWLRQGWHDKPDADREQALTVVTAIVKREARTPLERDATIAHIRRHVDEWE